MANAAPRDRQCERLDFECTPARPMASPTHRRSAMDKNSKPTKATPKQRMQAIFPALAIGDGKPFVDAMADGFVWTIPGTTAWSRRYEGKDAVRQELFRPLFAQFAGTYTNTATR